MSYISRKTIVQCMTQLAIDKVGFDNKTNEFNLTELVEATAIMMDHDEWLDDPDHMIWDIAIEVSNMKNVMHLVTQR